MANPLKRSLDSDSGEEDEPCKKKATTGNPSSPVSTESKSKPKINTDSSHKHEPINVSGHYKISISPLATHHTFSTESYTFSLHHYIPSPSKSTQNQEKDGDGEGEGEGDAPQLYARFSFDHLSGIMRLLPEDLYNAKTEDWDVYDFISYCALEDGDRPGKVIRREEGEEEGGEGGMGERMRGGVERWVMRWRGRDGGMRLGEKVGGEVWNRVGSFNFLFGRDVSSSNENENEEQDGENGDEKEEREVGREEVGLGDEKVGFTVVFAYDHKLFSFRGLKTHDLHPSEIKEADEDVRKMEKEWHELDNPAWYIDLDAEGLVQHDEEEEETSMFDLVNTPMPERKGFKGQEWELSSEQEGGNERSSPVKNGDGVER